jgi:hypothetical protein
MNILRSIFSFISHICSSIFGAISQFFAFIRKQIVALIIGIFKVIGLFFAFIRKQVVALITGIFKVISLFFAFIRKQIIALINSFKLPMATSINSMRGLVISFLAGLFVSIVAVGVQPFGILVMRRKRFI